MSYATRESRNVTKRVLLQPVNCCGGNSLQLVVIDILCPYLWTSLMLILSIGIETRGQGAMAPTDFTTP